MEIIGMCIVFKAASLDKITILVMIDLGFDLVTNSSQIPVARHMRYFVS